MTLKLFLCVVEWGVLVFLGFFCFWKEPIEESTLRSLCVWCSLLLPQVVALFLKRWNFFHREGESQKALKYILLLKIQRHVM